MIQWDALTVFGLVSVGFTALCYVLEARAPIWTLGFAGGCVLSSVYGFMQGAWPFGVIEIVWTVAALHKWWALRSAA